MKRNLKTKRRFVFDVARVASVDVQKEKVEFDPPFKPRTVPAIVIKTWSPEKRKWIDKHYPSDKLEQAFKDLKSLHLQRRKKF